MMSYTWDMGVVTTHIEPAMGYGGVAVSAARLTRRWAANNNRKLAVCATNASSCRGISAKDVQLGENVNVYLYHSYWFPRWGFGLGAIPLLFRLCNQSKIVYIHGIATWPTTFAAIWCCFLGRSFVVAPRGGLMPEHVAYIRLHKPLKLLFYRLLTLPTLRRSKAIHCTGRLEAEGARQWLGNRVNIELAPNGIDLDRWIPGEHPSEAPICKATFCYVGRISHEKGLNGFIKAWVRGRRAQDRLIVAGDGIPGPYFDEFLRLVEQAGGAIDFRGYLSEDEVRNVMAIAHFIVLPSGLDGDVRENFGSAVAEACASGRPVLVTKGLEWDALETEGAGLLFDRNLNAATEVVRKAITLSHCEWEAMARSARRYAENELDAEVVAERIWRFVQDAESATLGLPAAS
jgi:glycosyltransferase involved in cell wall biosynthesis